MSLITPELLERVGRRPGDDKIVIIRGVSWADYEAVLARRGEVGNPRIAYWRGTLQIMTTGASHEGIKKIIARLLEAYALVRGVDLDGYGNLTMQQEPVAGLEPDECYYVGPWTEGDRPHLAIEVVWTSGGIRKLPIYRALGVKEVWIWKKGRIAIHVLAESDYVPATRSVVLPDLDLPELTDFIDPKNQTDAVRRYMDRLRSR